MDLSRLLRTSVIAFLVVSHLTLATPARRHYNTHRYYALEHLPTPYGAGLAEVVQALGVEVVEQAGELENVWLVRVSKSQEHTLDTREEDHIDPVMAKFSDLQRRSKDDFLLSRSSDSSLARRVIQSVNFLEPQIPKRLVKRAPPPIRPPEFSQDVAKRLGLKDPLFSQQWYLVNDEYPEHMMNVTPVWDMGLTGKGVLTSFLDDGLDFDSEDLKDAFDAENSYDFNDHVSLPRPVSDLDHHGTRCAGQVAARRNEACGVGIAHESKVAGVRILGGPLTGADEATALNYGYQNVSLYSCSWGPRDDGRTMEGPNYLVRKAVVNGINNGRAGKGSIFVFASGNGGISRDQCNYDGYTNSIYSVTVSSVDYSGEVPGYSEACAANMISAYSSGRGKFIVTTDVGKNSCTPYHGGTSAAAPNAVGVFALALQARPDLTWRDIQHLCVETARKVNLQDPDWDKTATGRLYNYKYGYGVLDAYAFVTAAKSWKLVKPQAWIHTKTIILNGARFKSLGHKKYEYEGGEPIGPEGASHSLTVTKEMMIENNLESLEHIDVRVWINHSRRGDVKIEIISPNGIRSALADPRLYDDDTTGFPGWRLMTIKHWGENPIGNWTLKVSDQNSAEHNGSFLGWNMAFWGSAIDPAKAKKFTEPVVDNLLNDDPPRPVISASEPAPTSTTLHAKPTDHLPSTETPAGGNTQSVPPTATSKPKPQEDTTEEEETWYTELTKIATANKWTIGGLGASALGVIGAVVFLWRRRMARKKLEEYTSLAADDIQMDSIGENDILAGGEGPRSTRSVRFVDEDEDDADQAGHPTARSSEDDHEDHTINPPSAKGLGFHSSFLDDDEPSPALTPNYRDHPEMFSHIPLRNSTEIHDHDPPPTGGFSGHLP